AGELLDVVVVLDFAEQIPFVGVAVERTEDHIPVGIIESTQIPAVGIRNNRTVASCESDSQYFPDGSALTCAGVADDLDMFGLVLERNRNAGQRDIGGSMLASAGEELLFRRHNRASYVNGASG